MPGSSRRILADVYGTTGTNGRVCSKDRKVEGGGTGVSSKEGALRKKMYLRIR